MVEKAQLGIHLIANYYYPVCCNNYCFTFEVGDVKIFLFFFISDRARHSPEGRAGGVREISRSVLSLVHLGPTTGR